MDNYDINALTEMQKKRKKSKITIAAVAAYGLIAYPINLFTQ